MQPMPHTISASFDKFYTEINLPGDHRKDANLRRHWLERNLKAKFDILETLSFGSIPRFTALQDHADLDILVVLNYQKHILNNKPSKVLKSVRNSLSTYATSVRRNGQAVTLKFKSWPNVDIVPAAKVIDEYSGAFLHYKIPDMNREVWIPTNPQKHKLRLYTKASQCGSNFRKVITMMKHWNRVKNSSRIQSFHIEAIASETFNSFMTDIPWECCQFFQAAIDKMNFHYFDSSDISAYMDYSTALQVSNILKEAQSIAIEAWIAGLNDQVSDRYAIQLWRKVFGLKFPLYG